MVFTDQLDCIVQFGRKNQEAQIARGAAICCGGVSQFKIKSFQPLAKRV